MFKYPTVNELAENISDVIAGDLRSLGDSNHVEENKIIISFSPESIYDHRAKRFEITVTELPMEDPDNDE